MTALAAFIAVFLVIIIIFGVPQTKPRSIADLPAPAEDVLTLISTGKRVAAMRVYRKQTGATLLEAHRVIAHHAA